MNSALLETLNNMLEDAIKKKLKDEGRIACAKELTRVRGVLNVAANSMRSSQTAFARNDPVYMEVVTTLKAIAKEITTESAALENELQGSRNFSAYELQRINHHTYKIMLREVLIKMSKKIMKDRSQIRETTTLINPTTRNSAQH